MNCIQPELIAEGDLLAYVEGEASETIRAHVAACPACAQRAARLRQANRTLLGLLYRENCPAPEKLGQYQVGLLEAAERLSLAAHLRECPHCSRELVEMESALEAEDSLVESALRLIGSARRVIEAALVSPGDPATAALRGPNDTLQAVPQAYHAAGLDILIGFQAEAGRPAGTLTGAVVQAGQVAGKQAWLFGAQPTPIASTVDDLGTFTFEAIRPGTYDLALEAGENAILLRQVSL